MNGHVQSSDFGEWHVDQILIPRGAVRNFAFVFVDRSIQTLFGLLALC